MKQGLFVFIWDDDVQQRKLKCRGSAKIRVRFSENARADCLDIAVWPDGDYLITTGKESTFTVGETIAKGTVKAE